MSQQLLTNLTPYQIFALGSFGGTYWRPIKSNVTGKSYKNKHTKYKWAKKLNNKVLTSTWYDKNINNYKVKVGSTLEQWEEKKWITKYDPYGWVQWYCNYYEGRRCPDDARQIMRWNRIAGPNGRFRLWLITMIIKKNGKWNDNNISPTIRPTLQHWGYKLTKSHLDSYKKNK